MRCSTHAPYVLRKWSCALLLAWSYFFMHTWRHRGCLSQHGRRKTHAPESEPSWLNSSYRCVRLIRPKRRAEELDRACLQDPAARSQPSQVTWHPIAPLQGSATRPPSGGRCRMQIRRRYHHATRAELFAGNATRTRARGCAFPARHGPGRVHRSARGHPASRAAQPWHAAPAHAWCAPGGELGALRDREG